VGRCRSNVLGLRSCARRIPSSCAWSFRLRSSARSSSPVDWERYVSPASLRVRKNPPTKNSVSALSPFIGTPPEHYFFRVRPGGVNLCRRRPDVVLEDEAGPGGKHGSFLHESGKPVELRRPEALAFADCGSRAVRSLRSMSYTIQTSCGISAIQPFIDRQICRYR